MVRMFSGIDIRRGLAGSMLLALSLLGSAQAATPPYYSLQVASLKSEADALAILRGLRGVPDARIEIRGDEYAVRFGAWASRAEAEAAQVRFRKEGGAAGAFVLHIQKAAPWMLADTAAPEEPPAPAAAAAIIPIPPAAEPEAPPAPDEPASPPAAEARRPQARAAPAPADEPQADGAALERWWKTAQVRLEDLGWNDGFLLEGATGSRDLYLPVPAGIDARSAHVALNVHYGDSLIGESTVMLSVNGAPRRTLRRAAAGPAGYVQVQLPLTRRDLKREFVHVRFDYTQLADRDVCFSEALAGAWTRIEPDSGLTLAAGDLPPTTVRAAWALLPREVAIAADFSSLDPDEFQALFRLASRLRTEGREYRLLPVAPATALKNVPAHIVLAEPGAMGAAALPGSRSLYVTHSGGGARIVLERGNPSAVKVLSHSWRGAPGAGFLEVAGIADSPLRGKGRNSLRLSDLGFSEGERRFHRTTRWDLPLPFSAMGPAMRPDWMQLQVYAPDASGSGKPTVLSAYYNDRLVYSGTLAGSNTVQSVDFALPRHLLRARNQVSLVAQRDPAPGPCGTVATAHPISIAPASRILLKPVTDLPETFADLVPYEASLKIYLPDTALAAAEHLIPFLVAAGAHFWPSAAPPPLEFYAPDKPFEPDGPFLVVGQPASELEAPVKFDQGRVRIETAAGGQEFAMLEMQPVAGWALMQMAQAGGYAGAWVMAPGGYEGLPSQRILFEDEDVALLDREGVQMALRVGATRDYEVTYPDADSWFDAAGRMRILLFIGAWLAIATVIVYLLRVSRRHRDSVDP
jgi:hypothetical protein